jgi:hypothetical protein
LSGVTSDSLNRRGVRQRIPDPGSRIPDPDCEVPSVND